MQNDLLNATGKRNAVLDAALDGIASGLSIWTSDFKLIHWNRPFVSIYNLNPAEVQQGISLEKIPANRRRRPACGPIGGRALPALPRKTGDHHQCEADRTAGASAGSFCMRT
jgi:PAS domain-containing protein